MLTDLALRSPSRCRSIHCTLHHKFTPKHIIITKPPSMYKAKFSWYSPSKTQNWLYTCWIYFDLSLPYVLLVLREVHITSWCNTKKKKLKMQLSVICTNGIYVCILYFCCLNLNYSTPKCMRERRRVYTSAYLHLLVFCMCSSDLNSHACIRVYIHTCNEI